MPVPATPLTEAPLIEAFSSIQGEGILVGCRQIFLRLPGCNLDCAYCDTPFAATGSCQLEDPPGSGTLRRLANPVKLEELLETFGRWCARFRGAHHSFSMTGGEPLIHSDLLSAWLPRLRTLLPIYLETNGTLPDELERILGDLDWVSMDIKLESQTQVKTDWERHRAFLALASQVNCFVKLVVGEQTPVEELQKSAELVASIGSSIPLILQPVTREGRVGVATRRLLEMQQTVARIHSHVRVIPQTHVFMGVM